MFGGRSLFYSALSSAEGRRLDNIGTEVLCPGDRWSSSNKPFHSQPLVPSVFCPCTKGQYMQPGWRRGCRTTWLSSQPSDGLPSGVFGPFCLDHFLADHPDFVFQLKCVPPLVSAVPCCSLRVYRTALTTSAASWRQVWSCTRVCVRWNTPPFCCPSCPEQLCRPKSKFLQHKVHMFLVRCMYCQYDLLSWTRQLPLKLVMNPFYSYLNGKDRSQLSSDTSSRGMVLHRPGVWCTKQLQGTAWLWPGLKQTFKLVKSTICYRRNCWGLIAAGKRVQEIVRAEIVVLKLCSVGPCRGTCRFIKWAFWWKTW